MKKIGIILVNYKDYAEKYLHLCWPSILGQDYDNWELAIVDNASSAESYNYLKKIAPQAKIIRNFKNDGFAKGNNDAMRYFLAKGFAYIYLLNLDAYLAPDALSQAIKVAEANNQAGAVQSRLMLSQAPDLINSLGNTTNFLGFGYCLAYQQKYLAETVINRKIAYPSGAAVLLKAAVLRQVGLFDEKLWMYNEDQDLGWRIWLAGWQCLLAEQSVVYHDYEFGRSISKYYFMDRNRIIVAFKNYSLFSLLIFFPAFLIVELGLLLLALKGGWFKEKLRVWAYFLSFKNWSYLLRARKESQKLRKRADWQIIEHFSGQIKHQAVTGFLLKYLANPLLNLYFKITYRLIKLFKF